MPYSWSFLLISSSLTLVLVGRFTAELMVGNGVGCTKNECNGGYQMLGIRLEGGYREGEDYAMGYHKNNVGKLAGRVELLRK